MAKTSLSVNINKIALLRNARGEGCPHLLTLARMILEAGADGITLHPRSDHRHATAEDALMLRGLTSEYHKELNIEGNPLTAPRAGYPGLLEIIRQAAPDQVTLVPDTNDQLTSDHGWSISQAKEKLPPIMEAIAPLPVKRISLFMDPHTSREEWETVHSLGIDRVELYTKAYADAHAGASSQVESILSSYQEACQLAIDAGLAINAGHDLNLANLPAFVAAMPGLAEVSIGHALISDAIIMGLSTTVRTYQRALQRATS